MSRSLLPDRACFRELLRPWKLFTFSVALALLLALTIVDGVYVADHTLRGNGMYRWWNLRLSSATYFLAGTFWLYRGTLRELLKDVRAALGRVEIR